MSTYEATLTRSFFFGYTLSLKHTKLLLNLQISSQTSLYRENFPDHHICRRPSPVTPSLTSSFIIFTAFATCGSTWEHKSPEGGRPDCVSLLYFKGYHYARYRVALTRGKEGTVAAVRLQNIKLRSLHFI